ncbi:helix-turn-helix domain-containing protein [Streptomyces sulphureus]|uniref:helix-turn-helix domain-containing protein n=1 Tax=Streptomyces sulphureus TaxID=47758 RepID=UPI00037F4B22|nr:helix-turn-helix domain-containing protein [Streptomyces sulphureus]
MTARFGYAEAAAQIPGVTESWLRKHIKELPHSKVGRRVYFTSADLERIDAMHHVEPRSASSVTPVSGLAPDLAQLKPLPARRAA